MKMSRDELEYAISQYLDGTLSLLERDSLEDRLAADAEARALLEEYRQFNAMLKTSMPVPAVAWDKLANHLKQVVATEEAPVKHFSLGVISWTGRLAIAASLLFAIGVTTFLMKSPATTPTHPSENPQRFVKAEISGPTAEQPKGAILAEISVGPSPLVAAGHWNAGDEVVSRPTVVYIDQARAPSSGSEQSPY